jgi:hypothetical protein
MKCLIILFIILSGFSSIANGLTVPESPPTGLEQRIIPLTLPDAESLLGMRVDIIEEGSHVTVSVELKKLFHENFSSCDINLTTLTLTASGDEIISGATLDIGGKNDFLQFVIKKGYRFKLILPVKSGCEKFNPGKYTVEIENTTEVK